MLTIPFLTARLPSLFRTTDILSLTGQLSLSQTMHVWRQFKIKQKTVIPKLLPLQIKFKTHEQLQ